MKLSLAYPRVLGASQQNMCPSSVKVITQMFFSPLEKSARHTNVCTRLIKLH